MGHARAQRRITEADVLVEHGRCRAKPCGGSLVAEAGGKSDSGAAECFGRIVSTSSANQ